MYVRQPNTGVLAAAIERDWPDSLEPMALPHPLGAAGRPYAPPSAAHPATRILDDQRSLGQLAVRSTYARATAPGGPVSYPTMTADELAARFRGNPAIHAGQTQQHRRDQRIIG